MYVDKVNPTSQLAFRKYLKKVRLPGRLIISQLYDQPVAPKPAGKRQSAQGLARLNNPKLKTKAFWTRVGAVLEVIQAKKKITEVNLVIKALFDLITDTEGLNQNPDLADDVENVRRLIFGTVNFHCNRLLVFNEPNSGERQERFVGPLFPRIHPFMCVHFFPIAVS